MDRSETEREMGVLRNHLMKVSLGAMNPSASQVPRLNLRLSRRQSVFDRPTSPKGLLPLARQLPFQGSQASCLPWNAPDTRFAGSGSAAAILRIAARAGRACAKAQRRDCYKGEGDRVSGGGVSVSRASRDKPLILYLSCLILYQ